MDGYRDGVERYYIDDAWDDLAIHDGFAWLITFADEHLLSSVTIYIAQVHGIPELGGGIGDDLAGKLYRDRRLRYNQTTMRFVPPAPGR